jgi:hypothetical protein
MAQGFFPDTADIEQLTHALWKIRDQIAAAKTVENNLLDRLKRLGAPAITESHMEVDDQDMGNSPSTSIYNIFQATSSFVTPADPEHNSTTSDGPRNGAKKTNRGRTSPAGC